MADIWFISDTHFNHKNILKFEDKVGKKVREFDSVEHMNETMIENWNKCVKPEDKIYHLGDVFFGRKEEAPRILERLNGHKRLVLGNHDDYTKFPILQQFFERIMVWRVWDDGNFLFTHVPVHPSVLREDNRTKDGRPMFNIHGHIHQNQSPDGHYKNICVEQIGYTPVHIEDLRKECRNLEK